MTILMWGATTGDEPQLPPAYVDIIPPLTNDGIIIRQFSGNEIEYVIEDEIIESDQVEEASRPAIVLVDGNEHSWTEYIVDDISNRSMYGATYLDLPELESQTTVRNRAIQEALGGLISNSPGGTAVWRPHFNLTDKVRWVDHNGGSFEGRLSSLKIEINQSTDPFQRAEIGLQPLLLCSEPVVITDIAKDNFDRTAQSSGYGTAEVGGSWTPAHNSGDSTAFSTTGTKALIRNDGKNFIHLASTSETALMAKVKITLPTNLRHSFDYSFDWGLLMRYASATSYHSALLRQAPGGKLKLLLASWDSSSGHTVHGSHILPYLFKPGRTYWLQAEITGTSPTVLSAKAWPANDPEPVSYQITKSSTDSSGTNIGPQSAGSIGFMCNRTTGSSTDYIGYFDDFRAIDL